MPDGNSNPASRRVALKTGLAMIATAGVAGIGATTRARAQTKMAPKAVDYQTEPKDGHQCMTCVQFAPPNACKVVSGTISAEGWCKLYAPKGA